MMKSSKYVRKGECKKCGNCCRNIRFFVGDTPVSTEKQFASLKEWDKHYYNFHITGKDENGALLFACNELGADNKCKVYFFRALGCRLYPKAKIGFFSNGGEMLDGCGYYFEPDKNFQSYLNS